jgi:hypothetical protein
MSSETIFNFSFYHIFAFNKILTSIVFGFIIRIFFYYPENKHNRFFRLENL